jgi:hypothetical protein
VSWGCPALAHVSCPPGRRAVTKRSHLVTPSVRGHEEERALLQLAVLASPLVLLSGAGPSASVAACLLCADCQKEQQQAEQGQREVACCQGQEAARGGPARAATRWAPRCSGQQRGMTPAKHGCSRLPVSVAGALHGTGSPEQPPRPPPQQRGAPRDHPRAGSNTARGVSGDFRRPGTVSARPGRRAKSPRQAKTRTKKNIGVFFLQKKQEHEEAGTAKQGTERSL